MALESIFGNSSILTSSLTTFFTDHPYLFVIILAWALIWKGLALWKSATLRQPVWFVLILLLNTFGILEILYIFGFSKINMDANPRKKSRKIILKKK